MYHLIHPALHDHPCDVLNDIAAVVGAIDKLIVGEAELHLLNGDDLGGLCTILRAVQRGIAEASEALGEELAELRADRRERAAQDAVALQRGEIKEMLRAILHELRDASKGGEPVEDEPIEDEPKRGYAAAPTLTEEAVPDGAEAPAVRSSAVPTSRRGLHG